MKIEISRISEKTLDFECDRYRQIVFVSRGLTTTKNHFPWIADCAWIERGLYMDLTLDWLLMDFVACLRTLCMDCVECSWIVVSAHALRGWQKVGIDCAWIAHSVSHDCAEWLTPRDNVHEFFWVLSQIYPKFQRVETIITLYNRESVVHYFS